MLIDRTIHCHEIDQRALAGLAASVGFLVSSDEHGPVIEAAPGFPISERLVLLIDRFVEFCTERAKHAGLPQ